MKSQIVKSTTLFSFLISLLLILPAWNSSASACPEPTIIVITDDELPHWPESNYEDTRGPWQVIGDAVDDFIDWLGDLFGGGGKGKGGNGEGEGEGEGGNDGGNGGNDPGGEGGNETGGNGGNEPGTPGGGEPEGGGNETEENNVSLQDFNFFMNRLGAMEARYMNNAVVLRMNTNRHCPVSVEFRGSVLYPSDYPGAIGPNGSKKFRPGLYKTNSKGFLVLPLMYR